MLQLQALQTYNSSVYVLTSSEAARLLDRAGVVLPRPADAAATGGAEEAALINGGGGDESPASGQAPMYAPVPAGEFAWDSGVEERFARFVSVRVSVRFLMQRSEVATRICTHPSSCRAVDSLTLLRARSGRVQVATT